MKRWLFQMGVLWAASFSPGLAYALPSFQPALQDKEIRAGLSSFTYLTKDRQTRADERSGNLGLTLAIRQLGAKNNFRYGIEADGLFGLQRTSYRYFDVAEGFVGYEQAQWNLYLGRKRYEWNDLDSYWSQGLFQPRFRWDYLNERENGLFGIFAGFEAKNLSFVAYYSPIFIPEQGARFDMSDGACRSSSPWFACPTSSMFLFSEPTAVRFTLDVPPIRDLLSHQGYGATFRVGAAEGLFGRASYTHKPINQFLLSYEGLLLSSLVVSATIRPRVLYHDLYGFDLGWKSPKHSLVASLVLERPKRDFTPAHWNTQEASETDISGLTYRTQPFAGSMRHTRLEFSYLHREGGNPPDRGPFIQTNPNVFEQRFAFKNALSAALFTPVLERWAESFLFSTKFVVDTAHTGNILITDFHYIPAKQWFLHLGMDMMGSDNPGPVDFISRYQRNDRIRAGVAYAF